MDNTNILYGKKWAVCGDSFTNGDFSGGYSETFEDGPFAGKYKEIFNSDSKAYGGEGNVNPRAKTAKKEICDERDYSIKLKLPGLGVTILSCTPGPEEKPVKPAKTKTVAKKTSVNKEDKK